MLTYGENACIKSTFISSYLFDISYNVINTNINCAIHCKCRIDFVLPPKRRSLWMQKMRCGLSSNGVTHRTSGPGAIKLRRAYFWSKSHFKKKEPLIKQYFVDIHLKEAFIKNLLQCYNWLYLQLRK